MRCFFDRVVHSPSHVFNRYAFHDANDTVQPLFGVAVGAVKNCLQAGDIIITQESLLEVDAATGVVVNPNAEAMKQADIVDLREGNQSKESSQMEKVLSPFFIFI